MKMPVVVPWVNRTRLVVEKGMTGATGNYYCGLHEFGDMSFVLHYLRSNELFLDIGANVGTYSILAGGGAGAQVISIEPIPNTYRRLVDNVNLNGLHVVVEARNIGLGSKTGVLNFSADLDAENHVVAHSEKVSGNTIPVPVHALDEVVGGRRPSMIKIDVEGFETEVLRGGRATFTSPELGAVLIELNGAGSRYGFSEADIRQQFESWGFFPCKYDPFSRCLDQVSIEDVDHNGNTLYVKNVAHAREKLKSARSFSILGKTI